MESGRQIVAPEEITPIIERPSEFTIVNCWQRGCDISPLAATMIVIFLTISYYVLGFMATAFVSKVLGIAIYIFAVFYTIGAIISVRQLFVENGRQEGNQSNQPLIQVV